MSTTGVPADLPIVDAEFVRNLHSRNAKTRRETAVQQVMAPNGLPVWFITRYDDARAALADARLSKDAKSIREVFAAKLPPGRQQVFTSEISEHMLNMDPPDHTRVRKLVVKAFTPRRVEALRPRVEGLTTALLDAMAGQSEVDLLDAFAFPLPIQVICELLGVDESRRDEFRAWTNQLLDADNREASIQAAQAMAGYLVELIAAKRRQPADDLLTALIDTSDDEDRLSEAELISMVFLLLVAGHETTVNLIGNGVLALLSNREQWDALCADPDLVDTAVEEMLRFDGPVMHGTFRHTTEAVRYGDVEIPAGEFVWVGLASANHDPDRFADPDRFDISRDTHGHVAFGHGIHFCLGAQLARLEAQVALRGLVQRFPDMALASDDVQWRFSTLIRGLQTLPVRLRSA